MVLLACRYVIIGFSYMFALYKTVTEIFCKLGIILISLFWLPVILKFPLGVAMLLLS